MHPIVERINESMLEHCRRVGELIHGRSPQEIADNREEITRELSLLKEKQKDFGTYLSKPIYQLAEDRQRDLLNKTAAMMREDGVEDASIIEVLKSATKGQRGRPVEIRHLALQALILKHDDPSLVWPDLARKLYPSTVYEPEKRLKRDVARFRALYRKHKLHPVP